MGLRVLAGDHAVVRDIAASLPEGRIFESGKGFVPFVKEGVCATLEAHAKQFPKQVVQPSQAEQKTIDALKAAGEEMLAPRKAKVSEGEAKAATGRATSGKAAKSKPPISLAASSSASGSSSAADTSKPASKESAGSSSSKDGNNLPPKSEPFEGWANIKTGARVLAEDDPDDGWWEAEVTQVNRSGIGPNTIEVLTLKWTAFPEEPSFKRRANEVAYFHPAYGQEEPSDPDEKSSAKTYADAKAKTSSKA